MELLSPLTVEQVAAAYFFGPETARPAALEFVDNERTEIQFEVSSRTLHWRVTLWSKDGRLINREAAGTSLPIERQLHPSIQLRSQRRRGRAATNYLLCLDEAFRGGGLATILHEREVMLYRDWGAYEIQLNAGCEAKRNGVWFQKFSFEISSFGLQVAREHWSVFNGLRGVGRPPELSPLWAEWPKDFQDYIAEKVDYIQSYKRLR